VNGGASRFVVTEPVSGQQVVTDATTGIMWQGNFASGKNWQQALNYCATLNHGDFVDWRLPNRDELMSLVNYSRFNPASDFPTPSEGFWSSSSSVAFAGFAWSVNFYDGNVNRYYKSSTSDVRCVRGGP
jgi:hypothetical protein